ncbi:MAG: hypothetical protein MUC64_02880 [Rubritepida sp.]|jgi:hypothetical protein|nr:hypothetical protein [Rubritepida sp.]
MHRRTLLLGAAALPALAACQAPDPVFAGEVIELTATVETVDRQTREVLLSGPDRTLLTVVAGQAVRNFDQIRSGQRVRIRYAEAIGIALAPSNATAPGLAAGVLAARAAPGQLPGGAVGDVIRIRVRITGVQPLRSTVSFLGPRNIPRTVRVRDPELQAFVRRLRVGDEVDIAFMEAIAVTMEPA